MTLTLDRPIDLGKPIVLIDMDRPLIQWEEALVEVTRRIFPDVLTADAGTRLDWDLTLGLDQEQKDAVLSVMRMPGFYTQMKPQPGAREAIYEMLDEGIDVRLCSTPSLDNPTCASDKLASVDEHFGREITKRTMLMLDKTFAIGHCLIDDKPIIEGALVPTWTQVIYDSAYNQHATGPRLFNWADWRSVILPLLAREAIAA